MLNELIAKISAQTGLPPETVQPVLGAVLAHLGDILPAPLAHQVAIMLGIHQDDGMQTADASPAQGSRGMDQGLGGLIGGLLAGGAGGQSGPGGQFAGAGALVNVAESLLAGFLANRR